MACFDGEPVASQSTSQFQALLEALARLLDDAGLPMRPPVNGRAAHPARTPTQLPVLSSLGAVLDHAPPQCRAFIANLNAVSARLDWRQTYPRDEIDDAMLNGYGWTELVGAAGLVRDASVSAGLLLLGPHVHYPEHQHPALEHYLPLSGLAHWFDADLGWRRVPPLTPIVHRSGVPHAMRTGDEPLLAYFHWSGPGLDQASRLSDRPSPA